MDDSQLTAISCPEDENWQVICEHSLFFSRIEQLHEVCQTQFHGNSAEFVHKYLRPVVKLIDEVRSSCEGYYGLQNKPDGAVSWVEKFESIVTYAIHPKELIVNIHKGDFYLHVSSCSPCTLELKYYSSGEIANRPLSATDCILMCSENWTELLRSEHQDRFLYLNCILWNGRGYEKMPWPLLLNYKVGKMTSRSNSLVSSNLPIPLVEQRTSSPSLSIEEFAHKPLQVLELDFEMLHGQVAYLPGSRDRRGGPVICIDGSRSIWESTDLNSAELAKLLMYYFRIPRESVQSKGCSLVIDAREGRQTQEVLECIGEAIVMLQAQIPDSVHMAFVYIKRDSLLLLLSASKVKERLNFEFQFVSCFEKLCREISKDQLPEALGGLFVYDHEKWIKFRTKVEPFMAGCRSAAKHALTYMSDLSRTDYGYDSTSCRLLLEEHRARVLDVLEDSRLRALKSEGLQIIDRANREVDELMLTDDYRDTMDCVNKLYAQMIRVFDKLKSKSDYRSAMLELGLKVFVFREATEKIISWMHREGFHYLDRNIGTGDSSGHAQSLMDEFTQFSDTSKDYLESAGKQVASGRELVVHKDLELDRELLREKLTVLEKMTEEFTAKFNDRKKKLAKCLDFHQSVQEASNWQMRGLQYIANMNMEEIQTREGIQRLKFSLQEYMLNNPPLTESQLARITELAHHLGSKNVKLQAEQVSRQVLDVQDMLQKKQNQILGAEHRFKQMNRESVTLSDGDENSSGFKDDDLSTEADEGDEYDEQVESVSSDEVHALAMFSWNDGGQVYDENDSKLAVFDAAMPAKMKQRLGYIIREMVDTEHGYVVSLEYILDKYLPEMDKPSLPATLKGKRNVLFGNIERIYEFHKRFFSQELESYIHSPLQIGKCFLKWERQFYLYALYNKNKPRSDLLWDDFGNLYFQSRQKELNDKLNLASYLIKPVQRLGKYALLLRDMINCCDPTDPRVVELKLAQEMMRFQLRHGNDLLAMDSIKQADVNLKEQGCLLRQADFIVWYGKRKRLRRVFLFEHLMLFSKAKKRDVQGDVFMYKHSIKLVDLGLTETIGENGMKFEVWYRRLKKGRANEAYVLQASTEDVKASWTGDISRMLWRQARRNKEYGLTEASTGISVESTPSSIFSDTGTSNSYIRSRTMDLTTPRVEVTAKRLSWLSTAESSGSSGVHDLGGVPEDQPVFAPVLTSQREELRAFFRRNDDAYSSLPRRKIVHQNSLPVNPLHNAPALESIDHARTSAKKDICVVDPVFIRNNVFRRTVQVEPSAVKVERTFSHRQSSKAKSRRGGPDGLRARTQPIVLPSNFVFPVAVQPKFRRGNNSPKLNVRSDAERGRLTSLASAKPCTAEESIEEVCEDDPNVLTRTQSDSFCTLSAKRDDAARHNSDSVCAAASDMAAVRAESPTRKKLVGTKSLSSLNFVDERDIKRLARQESTSSESSTQKGSDETITSKDGKTTKVTSPVDGLKQRFSLHGFLKRFASTSDGS